MLPQLFVLDELIKSSSETQKICLQNDTYIPECLQSDSVIEIKEIEAFKVWCDTRLVQQSEPEHCVRLCN